MSHLLCPECNQNYTKYSWCQPCNSKHFQNDFDKWTSGNNAIDKFIQDAQLNATSNLEPIIEWIPHDNFQYLEKIAKGGFGTMHVVDRTDGQYIEWDVKNQRWHRYEKHCLDYVALKKLDNNLVTLNENFLNEITIHLNVPDTMQLLHGFSQDPETNEYIMVLRFFYDGNFRDYLKNFFNNIELINWKRKLEYLKELAFILETIHKLDKMHYNFHPGNILSNNFQSGLLYISDSGLSRFIGQNTKNPEKRQIFGVLPYMAPEVLSGEEYTKAADIYSFGIVAYEIVTGFAPYYDIPHDRNLALQICNGLRPKIPEYIPKLITSLIMRCWDSRVIHRPTFGELERELWKYYNNYMENNYKNSNEITNQIKQSEEFSKNKEKKSTPPPVNYKKHPQAIYTSRLFNFSDLPKPKNEENFEKKLEELTSNNY
ncbi:hypothetical protein Glove_17g73 [Diversispora epigaea]|uniref:Protein kinase domain-containing protein n=1 Tax=Diversispora epigaea TaxID=1348612 RepID=A0A397JT49_9GLOM|nr:hypothetical protein Glove_17g73 [Diversispora epigaea]